MQQLELVDFLTSSYKKNNKLRIIKSIIDVLDEPIGVLRCQCASTDQYPKAWNSAFLHMLKRTDAEWHRSEPWDCFAPQDIEAGLADIWLKEVARLCRVGQGSMMNRAYTGRKQIINVRADLKRVEDWLLVEFTHVAPALRVVGQPLRTQDQCLSLPSHGIELRRQSR